MSEMDALSPLPETYTLASGTTAVFEQLRTRQFFRLLRILTHGAGPLLLNQGGDLFAGEGSAFVAKFAVMLIMSIPDAEDETVAFLQSMVKPAGLVEGRKLTKTEAQTNDAAYQALRVELYNPDPSDVIDLVN